MRPAGEQWLAWKAAIGPAAIGLNFGIKLIVKRPRPSLEGLPPLGGAPSSLSFPSAHATASFAAATAMSRFAPELKPALFGAATAMAVTRPYLGMHFLPSDVIIERCSGPCSAGSCRFPQAISEPVPPRAMSCSRPKPSRPA